MNNIILFPNYVCGIPTDSITTIKTRYSLEGFTKLFDSARENFRKQYTSIQNQIDVVVNMIGWISILADPVLTELCSSIDKFRDENYILEIDKQYINLFQATNGGCQMPEYTIQYLEDFISDKYIQSKKIPKIFT